MATNKIQVVEKNKGRKIEYRQSANKIILGDDELMLNVAKYQKDWDVHIDVCMDKDRNLVIGVGAGRYYVAQLDVPAVMYEEIVPSLDDDPDKPAPKPLPLDMGEVVLTLWSLDALAETDNKEV